ncbi:MAG: error-prone DNA polymerase [Phycisphaerae bacterium]
MPDRPNAKLHTHPFKTTGGGQKGAPPVRRAGTRPARGPAYAELHCKTHFSFLRGASHPEELVETAAALGHHALAVTDRNSLAGVVRMHLAAKGCGLKLIVGAEIVPIDAPPVLLLAPDRIAYGRLSRLITAGRRRSAKGDCRITFEDVTAHAHGLIAVCLPWIEAAQVTNNKETKSRGLQPARPSQENSADSPPNACRQDITASSRLTGWLHRYREVFEDRTYLAAELCYGNDDAARLEWLHTLSRETRLPLVAANDVRYHAADRRSLHDILTCIRHQCTIHEAGRRLLPNARRHLLKPEEMHRRFAVCPEAVERTASIADQCHFTPDELRYEYPKELCPPGKSSAVYLSELTWAGADKRYDGRIPENVRRLLEHELALICELRYEPYFLTVHDIVRFARQRGILCQGRGSAANSAVCYCLGITAVDPVRIDLLFERFVSRERNEPPDIDVDFEHERREEVFQYIYEKYGRDRAAIAAEVITYRPRSAVRDVGKALGMSPDAVDRLAKRLDWWNRSPLEPALVRETGMDPQHPVTQTLLRLVHELISFPRHLSQHVGGFVITRGPLCETVPILNAAMPDRTFIEWDKDDLDAMGMLKVDCLALGMLTCVRKCFDLIGRRGSSLPASVPPRLALHTIPPEDPAVYDMIGSADTVGVFQIESRAQMSMLPRLRPRNFYDLVIEVAIVRPGPIQGGMVHPYLRRRNGEEPVSYPGEAVREVLGKTLGVPIFQEQAMRLAIVAAGFSPDEADRLRRAMAAWRRQGSIERFHDRFITGMKTNGYCVTFAEQCFRQIRGFGEYGFPESHAASFALLVYVSAWLKRYHPAAFAAALLNSQPMGFYAPAQIVRDASNHGVCVRGPDINSSKYDCVLEERREAAKPPRAAGFSPRGRSETTMPRYVESLRCQNAGPPRQPCAAATQGGARPSKHSDNGANGPAIRLGFRLIRGISPAKVEGIATARRDGPYRSVAEVARRSGASRDTLARLAAADAFRSIGWGRREALWQVLALSDTPDLFAGLEPEEPPVRLPPIELEEQVMQDYDTIGLSLTAHPVSLVRSELEGLGVSQNRKLKQCRQGQRIIVAGLVLVRQRPSTAGGVVFMTLEDETDVANLIVRPRVWERCRTAARASVALMAHGTVERQGAVVHVLVHRVEDLSQALVTLQSQSRDFH